MAKVRCRFCEFEVNKKCIKKKNSTVAINKRRSCGLYEGDEDKIVAWADRRQHIKTVERPGWFWSKAQRKKEREKTIQQEMEKYKTTIDADSVKDPKHPTTGNLSRFLGNIGKDRGTK